MTTVEPTDKPRDLQAELRSIDHSAIYSLLQGQRFLVGQTPKLPRGSEVTLVRIDEVRGYCGGWEKRWVVRTDEGKVVTLTSGGALGEQLTFLPVETLRQMIQQRRDFLRDLD